MGRLFVFCSRFHKLNNLNPFSCNLRCTSLEKEVIKSTPHKVKLAQVWLAISGLLQKRQYNFDDETAVLGLLDV